MASSTPNQTPPSKDASTHTVNLTFTVTPGEIYHLAAVHASALSPDMQATIARDTRLHPGVVADQDAIRELMQILSQSHLGPSASVSIRGDHEHHLATITVAPPFSKH